MTTLIAYHHVEDGEQWAKAWQRGSGSRHEMFGKIGVKARTFRDPDDPTTTAVMLDVPDMERFEEFMATDEVARAMKEDGLRVETLEILHEFTP